MFVDPLTEWEDGFPYLVLEKVGITPSSNMAEVKEASFALMSLRQGMSPEQRLAWDALRFPESRLVVDFFLYRALPATGDPGEPN